MKKKSIRRSARRFQTQSAAIVRFAEECKLQLGKRDASWAYDYAVIALYREFEALMKDALVGAVNNDSAMASATLGVSLPKHLSYDVCEYLVTAGRYFDFRGRDGLIQLLKKYVPDSHYLTTVVKRSSYRDAIDRLVALRNYAAHSSAHAKKEALKAVGQARIGSAGSWLKSGSRLVDLVKTLDALAAELEAQAPY